MLSERLRADPGASRLVQREPVHRLRRLPVGLPARGRRAFVSCPPARGRQCERVPRVRDLCRRLSDGGHATGRILRRRNHGGGLLHESPEAGSTASRRRETLDRGVLLPRVCLCRRRYRGQYAHAASPVCTPGPGPVYGPGLAAPPARRPGPRGGRSHRGGVPEGTVPLPRGQPQRGRPGAFVQRLLEAVGVEPERVRMVTTSAGEPQRMAAALGEMDRVIGALPPLPRT